MTATKDEALRVAREALPRYRWDTDMDWMTGPVPDGEWVKWSDAEAALRTIALAVEAPTEAVQSVALGEPKDDAAWDASQIKPPGWDHVFAAFVEGAREARANPDATEDDFRRAADGHTKRVFEEVDPVSEAALRTESWRVVAASASGAVGETAGRPTPAKWCPECRSAGVVGIEQDVCPTCDGLGTVGAGLPGTSNGQEIGNG